MSGTLTVVSAGPALSLQDMGRSGYLAYGLTPGGAADKVALHEAAALLRQDPSLAAIEMVGMGGIFQTDADTVIALTGAEMAADIDGTALIWNATHHMPAGAKLTIGGARKGTYGYLSVAGGIDAPTVMGARSSHLTAGIGQLLQTGQTLPIGAAGGAQAGLYLTPDARLSGGNIRIVPSIQTGQFSDETLDRFAATTFRRDTRGNRQGVRMATDTEGFFAEDGLTIVSEVITEGDIQITGDGAPYVLMCECQTTGGYPRIGSVIPSDLPRVAQAAAGTELSFQFLDLDEAQALERKARATLKALPSAPQPLVRDVNDIADLLSYQLVGGAFSATADPFST